MTDQLFEIANIDIPPKFYALFNSTNLEMFKHQFGKLSIDDRKLAIELYEKMLENKKQVLEVMKGLVTDSGLA